MSTIQLRSVSKRYADRAPLAVDNLSLDIAEGEFVVIVGPSGCGKTTALRMVAGLEGISAGDLLLDGERANDWPAGRRDMAMIFQSYALYPHLTVAENIGFPLRLRGVSRDDRAAQVREVAAALEVGELLDRRPNELSGGQRQRVAMGRAIIRRPRAFLMDEPLSNLDTRLRGQMRADIAALQRQLGTTTLYVTHDQVEAMTMADRIAVMRDGVLQQHDAPDIIHGRPANVFVAGFLGTPPMNLLMLHRERDWLHLGSEPLLPAPQAAFGMDDVLLGVRSDAITLDSGPGEPTLQAVVEIVENLGLDALVHVRPLDDRVRVISERLIVRTPSQLRPSLGATVALHIDPDRAHLFLGASDDVLTWRRCEAEPLGDGDRPAAGNAPLRI